MSSLLEPEKPYLSDFKDYVESLTMFSSGARPQHFSIQCFEEMQYQTVLVHAFDVAVDVRCTTCPLTKEFKDYEKLDLALYELDVFMMHLSNIQESMRRFSDPVTPDKLNTIGECLVILRRTMKKRIEMMESFNILDEKIIEKCVALRAEPLDYILKFLHSTKGKEHVVACLPEWISKTKWAFDPVKLLGDANTVFFMHEGNQKGFSVAAAEAFGVEVLPGRFIIQADPIILELVLRYQIATPLHIKEGTPETVVSTALALWEPVSSDILSLGSKALEAALNILN